MTQRIEVGHIVNKVGFEIDSRSMKTLDKFQKRMSQVKKQMEGLKGGFSLKASGTVKVQQQLAASMEKSAKATKVLSDQQKKKSPQELAEQARRRQAIGGLVGPDMEAKNASARLRKQMQEEAKEREKAQKRVEKRAAYRAKKEANIQNKAKAKDFAIQDFSKLKGGSKAARMLNSEMEKLNSTYRRTSMSAREYNQQASRNIAMAKRQAAATMTLNQRFLNLRHSMLGLGVAGAGLAGGSGIVRTGQSFEAMSAKMLMATGNTADAKEAMALARVEAKRLGMDLIGTSDSMARLGIAAKDKLSKAEFQDLFIAFSEVGTAANLSQEEKKRGLRALEQMLNKGQLMAEEVKGQFAEAIPGGISIFTRALEMTTSEFFKAMENGELLASETLPLVAKEMRKTANIGGALEASLVNNRTALGRMVLVFQDFKNAMFKAGLDDFTRSLYQTATNLMIALKPVAEFLVKTLAEAFKTVSLPVRFLIAALADLAEFFGADVPSDLSKTTAKIFGVALGMFLLIKTGAILAGTITAITTALLALRTGLLATAGGTAVLTTATTVAASLGAGVARGGALGFLFKFGKGFLSAAKYAGRFLAAVNPFNAWVIGLITLMGYLDVSISDVIDTFGKLTGLKEGYSFGGDRHIIPTDSIKSGMMKNLEAQSMKRGMSAKEYVEVEVTVQDGEVRGLVRGEIVKNNRSVQNELAANIPK